MEKYVPKGTKLININASSEKDSLLLADNWHKSDYGINVIFNEFIKMYINDILVSNLLV